MATKTLADVFGAKSKKGGGLADVLAARAPKAASGETSVDDILAKNTERRAALAAAGEKDPTVRKPNALARLFGVVDSAGTAVRATAYNALNPGLQNDVNIKDEIGKALKGEDRVEGADIAEKLGVSNKWGKMGVGFALDVLLDPLTYLTFGYSGAAKSAAKGAVGKLAVEGALDAPRLAEALGVTDDIARGVFSAIGKNGDEVLDIARLTAPESRNFMRAVMQATGDEGGAKFLGMTVAKSKKAEKVADTLGDIVKSTKPAEWFDKAFRYGDLSDVYRQGNEVVNAGVDYARRKVSANVQIGDKLADAFERQLANVIPDEQERMWVSVAIGRQFNDPAKIQQLAKLAEAAQDATDDATREGLLDAIAEFRSDLLDPAAVDATLSKAGFTPEARERAASVIEDFRIKMADNLAKQRAAGVQVSDLTLGGADSAGYLPGMAPRTERDALNEFVTKKLGVDTATLRDGKPKTVFDFAKGMRPAKGGQKSMLTLEDRLNGRTIEDILSGVDGATGKPIATELDLAILGGEATKKANRNVAFAEYQNELSNLFGSGEGADAVAKDLLSKTEKLFTNDDATRGMLKVYDKSLNLWKRWATVYNMPRFPLRNFGSNKVLQWMHGVLDPLAEDEAFRLIGKTTNADEVARILSANIDELKGGDRLIREAFEDRVLTTQRELSEQIGNEATKRGKGFIGKYEKVAGNVNELVENQSRLSAYIAARKKMGREGAALMVDKTLYSYDPAMLTSFERNFAKRLVPFYVWMRRNTPEMASLLVHDPKRIAVFGHLQETGEDVSGIDQSVMPEWMQNALPIPLPLNDKSGNALTMLSEGTLPIGDLDLVAGAVSNPLNVPKTLLQSASPLIKTPLELIFNRDLYYGDEVYDPATPVRRAPGYVEVFTDIAENVPGLREVWEGVLSAVNAQERTDPDTGDVYLAIDSRANKVLKDLNPWMNAIGKMLDDNPRQVYDQFSYLSGIKITPYDDEKFRRQQAYDDERALTDAIRAGRDEGVIPEYQRERKTKTLQDIFGGGR